MFILSIKNLNAMKNFILVFFAFSIFFSSKLYSQFLFEGTCDVYPTASNNISGPHTFYANDFRDSWKSVTQFKFDGNYYLFFYDRESGKAILLDNDCDSVREYADTPDCRKTWKDIMAADLNNDGDDELIFYDASAGFARICSLNKDFDLIQQHTYSGWRHTWKEIVVSDLNSDGNNEILFYDDNAGKMELYTIYMTSMTLLDSSNTWRTSWKNIKKIDFNGGGKGFLLYDPYNYNNSYGCISLLKYGTLPAFTEYSSSTYSKSIYRIETGNYGSGLSNGNVVTYEPLTQTGKFFSVGSSSLTLTATNTDWRKTWSIINSLKVNSSNDKLLFYESLNNSEIPLNSPDFMVQGLHPDIIIGNDDKLKMVYTPYPFSMDVFENPTVLESDDGFNFTLLPNPNVSNPLVNTPTYSNPPYYWAYNNDPDILNEGKYYYVVYNESFRHTNHLYHYQNIKVLKFNSDFELQDSKTIIIEPTEDSWTYSPSIIKFEDTYYIFAVADWNPTKIVYFTSNDIMDPKSWSSRQDITLNHSGDFSPWHVNVMYNDYDAYFYMLITGKSEIGDYPQTNNDLYIAKSSDLINWDLSYEPLMRKENYAVNQLYRSTGIFEDAENLTLWYSAFRINRETGTYIKRHVPISSGMFYGSFLRPSALNNTNSKKVEINNYPNPFNPVTNIKYSLPKAGLVKIKVYDLLGRMVKELVNEFKDEGNYSVVFNGANFASGVYFYKIETPEFVQTKKMLLIK